MDGPDSLGDFLEHYGVKGMKWGVRRANPADFSDDENRKREIKNKAKEGAGTRSLSNKELQDVITRMNLEKQYNQLNPSALKRGRDAVKKIIGLGGTANQVVGFANSPAGSMIKDGITSQLKKA